ncbi:MAG: metallophosphoesterase family protein [Pirellulaceae bacterium]
MKLLLFSDIHCSHSAISHLIARSADADVLVGAGDFGTMRRGLAETLQPLREIGRPLVLVPGNAESDTELREVADWSGAHVLHGNGVRLDGCDFFGLGGGIPVTPFGSWSFDLDEDVARDQLKDCSSGGVLVVHSPPFGAVDLSSRGEHLGSQAIRETVLDKQPVLTVCGHIHDSAGRWEKLGETTVVNAGPAGILWDLTANVALDANTS